MPDQTVSLESLLSHRSWALRMARRLVRGEDEAEELLQRTWMAALRRPPSKPNGARAWIAKVILNLVREQHRRDHARRRHEDARAATHEATVPDTAEAASRRESCQLLSELLLALGEPYRSTLKLRYYDDLTSVEIGSRLGVAPGTVRWRLKVGLDQLRTELDRRSGGDRTRWVSALTLLALDQSALPHEASTTPAATTPAAPSWLAPAGWVAAGAATLVASVMFARSGGRGVESAPPPSTGTTLAVSMAPADEEHGASPARRALPTLTPVESGATTAPHRATEASTLALEVLDESGAPVPSARVFFARSGGLEQRATTNAEGRVQLAIAPADVGALGLPMTRGHVSLMALAEGRVASELIHVAPPFGPEHPVQIRVGGVETVWRGRVVDERGQGVADATVAWLDPDGRSPAPAADDFTSASHVSTRTDTDGRFALHHLPGSDGMLFCFAAGFAQASVRPDEKHGHDELLIRLEVGALVSGRLSRAGRPAAGVQVRVEPYFKANEVAAGMPGYDFCWRGFGEVAITDENGAFELTQVRPGRRTLRAADEASASLAMTELQLENGGREHWLAELEPNPGLHLRIVDGSERPLSGWVAHVRRPGQRASWWIRRLCADENGRVSIPDCPRDVVFVDVFDPSGVGASFLSARLRPSAEEQVLRVETMSSCLLSGIVVDATGVPELGGRLVFHSLRTTLKIEVERDERGHFEQRLPAGAHDLMLLSEHSAVRLAHVVLVAGEARDLGLLAAPERGTLRLNGVALQNGGEREPSYSIFLALGKRMLHVARGPLTSETLLSVYAGQYRVLAFDAAGTPARRHEVRVEPSSETRLDLVP